MSASSQEQIASKAQDEAPSRPGTSHTNHTDPPDYATIDPNDGDRGVVPFPRFPMSANSSRTTLGNGSDPFITTSQTGQTVTGTQPQWPLASNGGAPAVSQSDSEHSYTSSRLRRPNASQARKFKLRSPLTANRPDPIAARRDAKKRSVSLESPGKGNGMPKLPSRARIAPGRGKITHYPVGSMSNLPPAAPRRREVSKENKSSSGGAFSRIGSNWSTTLGSIFSGRSDSAAESGNHGEGNSPSVLMDVRTESRINNRTSLPVNMPNVLSPIDRVVYDPGHGRSNSAHGSTVRLFNSPDSPEAVAERVERRPSTYVYRKIIEYLQSKKIH
jgi:hypothetical protein